MLKPRVGDLVRRGCDTYTFFRVCEIRSDGTMYAGGCPIGASFVEVIRPAKRRTLTEKQAREWLTAHAGWAIEITARGWSVAINNGKDSVPYHPTFTAAVIALRKKMGVK